MFYSIYPSKNSYDFEIIGKQRLFAEMGRSGSGAMNEDLLSWSERLVRIDKFERSRSVLLFIALIIAQFSLYYSVNNEEIIN